MTKYSLIFPDEFDEFYESEIQSKGYFGQVSLQISGKHFRLNFYDPVRLAQEIESEFQRGNVFFEPNLVVVKSVTRLEIEKAIQSLMESGNQSALIAD